MYYIETICSLCGGPISLRKVSKETWDSRKGESQVGTFEYTEEEAPYAQEGLVKLAFSTCFSCRGSEI